MKTLRRSLLVSSLAFLASASLVAAAVPSMNVTVSDSSGKLLFKGKTDDQGSFTTKTLAPDNYVVQFNSDSSKGGPYAVVISAGKKKVMAESVPASKFSKGGVALRVEVSKAMSLTGQVAAAGNIAMASNDGSNKGNARVKYINGKKYVWVQSELGSNIGGRWVDANSPEARKYGVDSKTFQDIQSRGQRPGDPNGGQ